MSHNEPFSETEHYLITSGRGKFTVGAEERDIEITKVNYESV